jgi:hypothetical protein
VPVQVSKAGELYVRVNSSTLAQSVKLSLWKDAAATAYSAASTYDSYFTADPSEVKTGSIPVAEKGTYYLRIEYTNAALVLGSINISVYAVSSENRTMKKGTWSAFAPSYNSRVTYGKVTVASAGYIGIKQTNSDASKLTVSLCDSKKTVLLPYAKYLEANKTAYYPVKKGTYYIKTEGVYNDIARIQYTTKKVFKTSQGKKLTVPILSTTTFDVKIKAEKTGLLTLQQYNNNSWYCTFLNSKKKALSDSLWNWGSTNSLAVKKGQTYYFRIKASIGNDDRTLSYSIAKAATAKNTSAKKAIQLKKNKSKATLILNGDKKWHYYKIKLTKAQKLNLSYTAAGNGEYLYSLLKGKKSVYVSRDTTKGKFYTYSKLSKGTYYFRVKCKSKSSGKFTFKLK